MDSREPAPNAHDDWQRVGRPHSGLRDQSRSNGLGLILGTARLRLQRARGRTAANRRRDLGDLAVDRGTSEGRVELPVKRIEQVLPDQKG